MLSDMTEPHDRQLLSTREVAELLGTTQPAVGWAIRIRNMPVAATTRYGHHRLDRDAVLAWAATNTFQPSKPRHAWLETAKALEVLGPATTEEIAAYRGIHPGNVRKHLLILDAEGAVERGADGQWSLRALQAAGAA